jgi:hypothetical protein
MSLLGKILMVLNIVAALLFLMVAMIDWGTRQLWAYQVLRHDLALNGLPVDASPDFTAPGTVSADDLHEQTLEEVFKPVGGNPVRTQVEEIQRKRDELEAELKALPVADRTRKLKDILMALTQTGDERDRVAGLTREADLWKEYNRWFDEALSPDPDPDNEQRRRDFNEQRRAIAHLLYNLSPDPAWQQRVMVVVGVRQYLREGERQAADLERMAQRARELTTSEEIAFINQYKDLIARRTQELARQNELLQAELKKQEDLKEKHTALVKAREEEIKEFREKTAKAKEATAEALLKQHEQEKELFEAQKNLIDDFDRNIQLERQIRRLELGR